MTYHQRLPLPSALAPKAVTFFSDICEFPTARRNGPGGKGGGGREGIPIPCVLKDAPAETARGKKEGLGVGVGVGCVIVSTRGVFLQHVFVLQENAFFAAIAARSQERLAWQY